jgi:ABC-type Fe3+ transport system permease subunit
MNQPERESLMDINWPLVGAVIVMAALIAFMYSVDFKPA